jgi:hypothetical protein
MSLHLSFDKNYPRVLPSRDGDTGELKKIDYCLLTLYQQIIDFARLLIFILGWEYHDLLSVTGEKWNCVVDLQSPKLPVSSVHAS